MLSGAISSAFAMAGTAVLRIVVSSDSMKNATATSHGNSRFTESAGATAGAGAVTGMAWFIRRAEDGASIRANLR
jgi:hypothetical protein